MNAFGMSTTTTSISSFVSITAVKIIDSNADVGLEKSYLIMHSCCLLPFAHVLAVTIIYFFSEKINYSIAIFLSTGVDSSTGVGLKHTLCCR